VDDARNGFPWPDFLMNSVLQAAIRLAAPTNVQEPAARGRAQSADFTRLLPGEGLTWQ
jgi:hypothetical protein